MSIPNQPVPPTAPINLVDAAITAMHEFERLFVPGDAYQITDGNEFFRADAEHERLTAATYAAVAAADQLESICLYIERIAYATERIANALERTASNTTSTTGGVVTKPTPTVMP